MFFLHSNQPSGVDMKIQSKVLANRLEQVVPNIVSTDRMNLLKVSCLQTIPDV